ncbi:histone acetyltransferase type B catalytic subunit [Hysterangium stoloniferum]|nr:histone acetyltransferase type B catalytic subunit [Hysterangium stoloniferum]
MASADSPIWTANSNDALYLSMVRAKEDQALLGEDEDYEDFHPTFTYPIFGEEEKIYGYQNLRVDLKFASGSLVQYLSIKHSAALPKTADDIERTLYKFIPSDYLKSEPEFRKRVEQDAHSFRPIGTKIASYTRRVPGKGKGKTRDDAPIGADEDDTVTFEVYHTTMSTPGFRDYHRRMQLFILLYIEAGSYIQEDDDRWEFVVLYERRRRKDLDVYHFAGYSSLYPFWCWPDKIRLRLSQFVILTPYQRHGHGSELYNALYRYLLTREDVLELTIEDPAEAFEDLRDKNDLQMLLENTAFTSEGYGQPPGKGKLGPPANKAWVEQWRVRLKIAKRQFQRLIEMLILRSLQPSDAKAARAFRLQVKERLYRFNFDALVQLDKEERIEKLEVTYQNVQEGYQQILARVQ